MQTTFLESPSGPHGESNSIGFSEGTNAADFSCVLDRNDSLKFAHSRFFISFRRELLNIKRDTTALATRFGITIFLRQALHLTAPLNYFMLMIEFHGP